MGHVFSAKKTTIVGKKSGTFYQQFGCIGVSENVVNPNFVASCDREYTVMIGQSILVQTHVVTARWCFSNGLKVVMF